MLYNALLLRGFRQVCHALLKRTCIQREVQMVPVVSRWHAVAVPAKLAVQPLGEVGWRTYNSKIQQNRLKK